MTTFLNQPSRYLFFTGKGGVGKTALACATAIRLADAGKRVLLVSTDPASNLDEMLGVALSIDPRPSPARTSSRRSTSIPRRRPTTTASGWSRPYRADLVRAPGRRATRAALRRVHRGDRRVRRVRRAAGRRRASVPFDHVVFDTAPTGHTLRLLSLPRAWTGFLQIDHRGRLVPRAALGLKMQETRFAAAVEALGDRTRTTIVLVTRPDRAALREADRTSGELEALGIKNQQLVVNGVFQATDRADPRRRRAGAAGTRGAARDARTAARTAHRRVPLRAFNMVGLPALRALLDDRSGRSACACRAPRVDAVAAAAGVAHRRDRGAWPRARHGDGQGRRRQDHRRRRDRRGAGSRAATRVHLSTTDPAAHVAATLEDSSTT